MRLDFNILWVEDQPARVKSYEERIDREIRKEGFRLRTAFPESVDDAKKMLASDIYSDNIDLVVMDYDLGAGLTGEDGLIEVRSTFPYKDIVFYSAEATNIESIVAKRELQGIFCSDRVSLAETIIGVFETLVKKVLDIDHARGIIMGSSSEIDALILNCLEAHFSKSGDLFSDNARQIIAGRVKKTEERLKEDLAAVLAATKVSELANLHLAYTSMDRLNLLRKLLEAGGSYAQSCASMKSYADDTIPKRNMLAHVRVTRGDGFSRKLVAKDGKELSSADVKKLFRAVLQHQEVFEELVVRILAS